MYIVGYGSIILEKCRSKFRIINRTRFLTHLNDLLDEELVGGHLGLLHHGDAGADPGHQREPRPLGHLVTSLNKDLVKF